MPEDDFDPRELKLFFVRLEQLFDAGQLVIGATENGERRACIAQLHLGFRPKDGKHAILLDIDLETEE